MGEEGSNEDDVLAQARSFHLKDRVGHRHWKVRLEAYKEVADAGAYADSLENSPIKEFAHLAPKAVEDANVNALDAAVDALTHVLRVADEQYAQKNAGQLSSSLVSKGLSGKPATVSKTVEALMLLVELDAHNTVMDALLGKGANARAPKVVAAALDVIYQIVSSFGTKVIDAKPIFKALPNLFEHKDKNVREKAKAVAVELASWLGSKTVEKALLQKVRENQKREVEDMLSNVEERKREPSRLLRKEARERAENGDAEESCTEHENKADTGNSEDIASDFVEPTDVLSKLNTSRGDSPCFWDAVESQKWKERHEALSYLKEIASSQKLADGDYHHLSSTLKKVIQKDANVVCVAEACSALAALVNGLGNRFRDGKMIAPHLFPKLKEKKDSVCNAALAALRALFTHCLSLSEMMDELLGALSHKTPKVQMLSLQFLAEHFPKAGKQAASKVQKDLFPAILQNLEHSTPEVRDAAVQATVGFCKAVGSAGMIAKHVNNIEDSKRKKLEEALASQLGMGPRARSGQSQQMDNQAKTAERSKPEELPKAASANDEPSRPESKRGESMRASTSNLRQSSSKPAGAVSASTSTKPGSAGNAKAKKATSKESGQSEEDVAVGHMSSDEMEQQLQGLAGEACVNELRSSDWKQRLNGVQTLFSTVENDAENSEAHCEAIVRALGTWPGWQEKNIQVMQNMVRTVSKLIEVATSFGKKHAKLVIVGLTPKLSDSKLNSDLFDVLTKMGKAVGPRFVLVSLSSTAKEEKNPKVLAEALNWTSNSLDTFGVALMDFSRTIEFARGALSSTNPGIKQNAIKVFGVLHKQVGAEVKRFTSDVKPALQNSLESEFARNPYEGIREPKVDVRGMDPAKLQRSVEDVVPRQDISDKITSKMISDLANPKWQERQAALESIEKAINQSGNRICGVPNELVKELRNRLSDTHRNLAAGALYVLGNIASALGQPFEKKVKMVLPDVIKCWSDGKKQVKEATAKCIEAFNGAVGSEKFLPAFAEQAGNWKLLTTAEGKKDAIEWMAGKLSDALKESVDPTALLVVAANGLNDKATEVRSAGSNLLETLSSIYGCDRLLQCQIPQGLQRVVTTSLQKNGGLATTPTAPQKATQQSSGQSGQRSQAETPSTKGHGDGAKADVASGPPMHASSNKESRLQKVPRRAMSFEDALNMAVGTLDELERDFAPNCRQDLREAMFSSNFKLHVYAADVVEGLLRSELSAVVSNLDLVFRWIAQRFAESQPNTQSLLRIINLTNSILVSLKAQGYRLADQEAAILMPALVEKAGHNIEKIRQSVRTLFKGIYGVYPVSKCVPFLLEGARSKNSRMRAECLEEIGNILHRHGLEVGEKGPNKGTLAALLKLVGEHDTHTRTAALNALSSCYMAEGSSLWSHLDQTTAEASILRDKLTWVDKESQENLEQPKEKPTKNTGAQHGLQGANVKQSEDNRQPLRQRHPAVRDKPPAEQAGVNAELHTPESNDQQKTFFTKSPSARMQMSLADLLEQASAYRDERCVEALKHMYNRFQAAMEESNGTFVHLVGDPDNLSRVVIECVEDFFRRDVMGFHHQFNPRPLKYALHCLMKIFEDSECATSISHENLKRSLDSLLGFMLHPNLNKVPEGHHIVRALNMLSQKILWNTPRTNSLSSFLQLLRKRYHPDVAEEAQSRWHELVVKCLIKHTKALSSSLGQIDTHTVFLEIHWCLQHFQEQGLTETGNDTKNKPLRMVKTLLYELCRNMGSQALEQLECIPAIKENPSALIRTYVSTNVASLQDGQEAKGGAYDGDGRKQMNQSSSDGKEAQLNNIFLKISSPSTCNEGLDELSEFERQHPEVDISSHVSKTSESFQKFIDVQLRKRSDRNAPKEESGTGASASAPSVASSANEQGLKAAREMPSVAEAYRQRTGNSRDGSLSPTSAPSTGGGSVPLEAHRQSLESLKQRMHRINAKKEGRSVDDEHMGTNLQRNEDRPASGSAIRSSVQDLQERLRKIERLKQGEEESDVPSSKVESDAA